MQIIESIILGLTQGLTEFIPVSSSGHLVILQVFFTGNSEHLFLQFIDIGTTLALLVYFRKRIASIAVDIFKHKNYRLARNVLITAIPAGFIGLLFARFIESSWFFGNVLVVAVGLTLVGVVMIILEKLPKASAVTTMEALPARRALVIGLVQIAALIPGVSRSGSTIIAGRLSGFNPAHAAEYSFLVSIPIMLGVCAKVLLTDHDYLAANLPTLIISNAAAFVAAMIAISFLLHYLKHHTLVLFGWYRVLVGLSVIGFVLVQ